MFRILWQVCIGEIRKKDAKNANKIKKILNSGIYEEF